MGQRVEISSNDAAEGAEGIDDGFLCALSARVVRNRAGGSTPTPVGATRQLQSDNFQRRYLRHQGYRARIDEAVSPVQDA